MGKLLAGSIAAVTILLLAGCTATSSEGQATSAKPVASSTATPTPTPTAMSTSEAADYYLDTVCPANAGQDAYNKALAAYNAATTKDYSLITNAADKNAALDLTAAKRFDDAKVLWPDGIKADVDSIRDSYFSDVSSFQALAATKTLADGNAVVFDSGTADAGAAQRIRSRLDISSDPISSCKGH